MDGKKNKWLGHYSFIYESLISVLVHPYSIEDTEKGLAIINLISTFALQMHPGRFVDLRLEYFAARIGEKIWKQSNAKKQIVHSVDENKVLHVATETYSTGGHTRLLLNLIKGDRDSVHCLVLTNQIVPDVPEWLQEAVLNTGGEIISLATQPYSEQVASLQLMLCDGPNKVFYHIHPNDSVAVAALAAVPRPQVLTINHADHLFWLGSALSDVVVCFRVSSLESSILYRAAQKVMLLPTPLDFAEVINDAKVIARQRLGISPEFIVILTVASGHKFIPTEQHNYYRVIKHILDKNPNVLVKIVGISGDDDSSKFGFEHHDRIELLGSISNPQAYYEAADIYLDSMPLSSTTSLLEAMFFSCFPVIQFSPTSVLNVENEPALKGLVVHADNEQQQLAFIQEAIDDKSFRKRIAAESSERIQSIYMGKGWQKFLQELYSNTSHQVTAIRNLEPELSTPIISTQRDVDAANLSHSVYRDTNDSLLRILGQKIRFLGFSDIMRLFLLLGCQQNNPGQRLSTRDMLWLIKLKVKNII